MSERLRLRSWLPGSIIGACVGLLAPFRVALVFSLTCTVLGVGLLIAEHRRGDRVSP